MFGILAFVVETTLMMLEPMYQTFKGLEANETGEGNLDPEDWRRLLIHWIVYGAFRAVESLARPWVPFYDVVKIGTIVWLRSGGSDTVYQTIIRPFLVEHEPDIDQWIEQLNRTRDTVMSATAALSSAVTADPDAINDGESEEMTIPEPVIPSSGSPVAAGPAVTANPAEPVSGELNEEQRRKDQ
ncbi:receptor expression-enhancing protein 5-like [Metopolophium dirhodum]|uniref:receptor expression-enhancing protein 5-like n=1 Tax=Metopolophium dirhodum TaxID=44670 RepID=UPI00298F80EB|nr:receptor expression-enhancing protein 5-like [Metopolophium dirhodum]